MGNHIFVCVSQRNNYLSFDTEWIIVCCKVVSKCDLHLHFGDLFVFSNAGFVHALVLVVLRFDVRGFILGMVARVYACV